MCSSDLHPRFRPHLMQGWTPDFIPRLTGDALASQYVDRIVPVSGTESLRLSRELALKEGILTGITGGATLAGALAIARAAPAGTTILLMLPDPGDRYLRTVFFEHIAVDITADELQFSTSTPTPPP